MAEEDDVTTMREVREVAVCEFFAKCFSLDPPPECLAELSDGVVMFQALSEISMDHFDPTSTSITHKAGNNWALKAANLRKLVRNLQDYYHEELNKDADFESILSNVNDTAKDSDPDGILAIVELVAVAAISCEDREVFVNRMREISEENLGEFQMFLKGGMEAISSFDDDDAGEGEEDEDADSVVFDGDENHDGPSSPGGVLFPSHGDMSADGNSELLREREELRKELSDARRELAQIKSQVKLNEEDNKKEKDKLRALNEDIQERLTKREKELHIVEQDLSKQKRSLEEVHNEVNDLKEKSASLADELDVEKGNVLQLRKAEAMVEAYRKKVESIEFANQQMGGLENQASSSKAEFKFEDLAYNEKLRNPTKFDDTTSLVADDASSTEPTTIITTTTTPPTTIEEGISVFIRLRPINSRRGWVVLKKINSVAQCTPSCVPLPERISNRNFFTYDKTFGETSTTRQVYDGAARGIVQSVSDGLNGTIFAYGQTSSGKTFTMQGSGSVVSDAANSNSEHTEGIVHMAANDIFNHIEKESQRVFLVRVSFIEIYNEEVRDLLVTSGGGGGESNGATLTIREDKQRGVFVNSNETIVTSIDGLLSVLFAGEKNRHVGSTAMNERSSRSHTIFRITVESRLNNSKDGDSDDDDEDASEEEDDGDARMGAGHDVPQAGRNALIGLTDGNGAVRVSTLNLVDLAGSESVRHTGATGDRQKEGVKINLSLLTLSRVISNLGQGAAHINFRDSKLTRILQPSLSGNARMAVICCATPSDLYLEETRSTLQFASRAKLVKTRAQVNEVMDDRSLIRKLKRELKEARRGGPDKETMEQMKALEEKAASAEDANRKAEQDLKRMKEMLMKGGVLNVGAAAKASSGSGSFVYNGDDVTFRSTVDDYSLKSSKKGSPKRRHSDGNINKYENGDPPRDKLEYETGEQGMAKHDLESQVTTLASDKDFALQEQDIIIAEKDSVIASSMEKIETLTHEQKEQAQVLSGLEAQVESLQGQLATKVTGYTDQVRELNDAQSAKKEESSSKIAEMEGTLEMANSENSRLVKQVEELSRSLSEAKSEKDSLQTEFDETMETVNSNFEKSAGEQEQKMTELSAGVSNLTQERDSLQSTLEERETKIAESGALVKASVAELDGKNAIVKSLESNNADLEDKVGLLQASMDELTRVLGEKESSLGEAEATIAALRQESLSSNVKIDELMKAVNDLKKEKEPLEASAESSHAAQSGLESATAAAKLVEAEAKVEELRASGAQIEKEKKSLEESIASLQEGLLTESGAKEALQRQVQKKDTALNDLQSQYDQAFSTIEKLSGEKSDLDAKASGLEIDIATLKDAVATLDESLWATVQNLEAQLEVAENDVIRLTEENNASNQINQDLEANLSEMANANGAIEASIVELVSGNGNMEQIMQAVQSEKDDLASKLEEAKQKISMIEASKEELKGNLEAAIVEKDRIRAEMSKIESEQDAKLFELSEGMEEFKGRISSLTSELETCKSDHGDTKSQMAEVKIERAVLQACVDELRSGSTNSQEMLLALEGEKASLSSRLEEATSQIEAKDTVISSLAGKVQNLGNDISVLTSENTDLHSHASSLASLDRQQNFLFYSIVVLFFHLIILQLF